MPLYIVATPIGNLEEITPRAVKILGSVDLIGAEDTRHSRNLLNLLGIPTQSRPPILSCHKFNEDKRVEFFLDALREGRDIALISDAGTPCISDPGFRLVRAAAEAGFDVVPICGASAVVAALSVSGFDASAFLFLGFLPRGKAAVSALSDALSASGVVAFYESPRRISKTLTAVAKEFPAAAVCLCNDISKKFERIYRGNAAEILAELSENPAAEKGEYTCILHMPATSRKKSAPQERDHSDLSNLSIEARLVDIMAKSGCTIKDASRQLFALGIGFSKKEIYAAMLRVKEMFG